MTAGELVALGTEIVNEAEKQGSTLRMYGGVAIYARCPSIETHASLQREYVDLDLVAAENGWNKLPEFFQARGFAVQENAPTKLTLTRDNVLIDVRAAAVSEDFSFDLAPRLNITPLTLPLADLLLLKLARVKFADKEIKDSAALLLDHRVSDGGDEEDEINRAQIYRAANRDYRLWKTIFDNTVTLEKIFDKYLEPEEGQLAWRRIERIQEVLDGKSHSLGWWVGRVVER